MKFRSVAALVVLTIGILWAPLTADAQQLGKAPRIGLLWPGASPPRPPRMEAFRQRLRESGYAEGENIAIDLRYAEGGPTRLPDHAAELVQLHVNVIAAFGDQAARVAQQATTTIPIVALTDDIVGAGLVASLARPGGNTTGVTMFAPELGAKRLELLKQLLPGISRVAVLWDPGTPRSQVQATEDAARALAVRLQVLDVRHPGDIDRAFQAAKKERAEALTVLASPLLSAQTGAIVALAATSRLPVIYQWRKSPEAGGLISYGVILPEMWRQTALMVAKILKGARPADLPAEQPTRFELVINRKTARALGLTIPQSLLLRADHVIE